MLRQLLANLGFLLYLVTSFNPHDASKVLLAMPKGTPPRARRPTRRDRDLANILDNTNYERGCGVPMTQMEDDDNLPAVLTAAKAADLRKGGNIKAIRISHMTEVTTFMIIVEGNSKPQIIAIATYAFFKHAYNLAVKVRNMRRLRCATDLFFPLRTTTRKSTQ